MEGTPTPHQRASRPLHRPRQRRESQGPRHPRRHPHAARPSSRSSGPATPEEKQILARFAGFGPVALSIFPDPVTGRYKDAGWQALGEELKSLLTPEEYDSAKRTTFNAFYTSPTVIAAMHEAIARLGVPGNATVLEPGCGTGNFMSHGQPGHALHRRRAGLASPAASPGRCIPSHDIRIENFRDTRLPEDRIDAVIGNVPFADVKLDYHGQKLSLHDYFFAKSVDALKPGGVLALVTSISRSTSRTPPSASTWPPKADFLGAIRLPSDAFKREGTAVVTDIVFLRKRAPGEPAHHADPDWLGVAPLAIEGAEVPINRYFLNHPEMVLGNWTPQGHALRRRRLQRHRQRRSGRATQGSHPTACREFAPIAGIAGRRKQPAPAFTPPPPERHIAEGSFFVGDDRVIHQIAGRPGRARRLRRHDAEGRRHA